MANHFKKGRRHHGNASSKKTPSAPPRERNQGGNKKLESNASFSLRDEARNTERNHGWWSSDLKLRHRGIVFTSGGRLHGDDHYKPSLEKPRADDSETDAAMFFPIAPSLSEGITTAEATMAKLSIAEPDPEIPGREIETCNNQDRTEIIPSATKPMVSNIHDMALVRDESTNPSSSTSSHGTGLDNPKRSPSPALSNSSEDIVVFKGRGSQVASFPISNETVAMHTSTYESSLPSGILKTALTGEQVGVDMISTQPTALEPHVLPKESSCPREDEKGEKYRFMSQSTGLVDHSDDGEGGTNGEVLSAFIEKRIGKAPAWDYGTTPWEHRSKPGVGWTPQHWPSKIKSKRKKGSPQRTQKFNHATEMEDEALADYIENLRENSEGMLSFNGNHFSHRNLLPYGQVVPKRSQDSSEKKILEQAEVQAEPIGGWDDLTKRDVDNISTSSDVIDTVEHIIRKRVRHGGVQYLVIYEGSTADDARWLPSTFLSKSEDLAIIRAFEASLDMPTKVEPEPSSNNPGGKRPVWVNSTGDEEEAAERYEEEESDEEDEYDEEEREAEVEVDEDEDEEEYDDDNDNDEYDDLMDEGDLVEQRLNQMTDEQIAWTLAKQEELGYSTDEVFLFNDVSFESHVYDEVPIRPSGGASYRRRANRSRNEYPSASLMADALDQDPYDGFDVMDFDRPSLKKKGKGRQSQHIFDFSDKELEDQLHTTWEADREKKRLRKQKRQELREQGLLGKKNKFKPDLLVKYSDGITSHQLLKELRDFWTSTLETRAFPPMDKKDRKVLHEIASKLAMNSKSRGSGKNRFPIVTKTSRTPEFNEVLFARINELINGRISGIQTTVMSSNAATTYRNGDIVGAGAPEIGKENRGRVMLERMGWTSGTALGATHNKGILEPISHTFKASKHGLGQ